jgi:hypothetical protein
VPLIALLFNMVFVAALTKRVTDAKAKQVCAACDLFRCNPSATVAGRVG